MPSLQFLFDPENNIELGSAYLSVLTYNHLEAIANRTSREYCVISACNTGPGDVLGALSADRVAAVNRMQPPAAFQQLRRSLPYAETRQYLVRVTEYPKQFARVADRP